MKKIQIFQRIYSANFRGPNQIGFFMGHIYKLAGRHTHPNTFWIHYCCYLMLVFVCICVFILRIILCLQNKQMKIYRSFFFLIFSFVLCQSVFFIHFIYLFVFSSLAKKRITTTKTYFIGFFIVLRMQNHKFQHYIANHYSAQMHICSL